MNRIGTLGGLLAGLFAAPALAVTLTSPPVTMGDHLQLRCNVTNVSSYPRQGTVCSVNVFSSASGHICHSIYLSPGRAYASPAMAVDGSYFCRFQLDGTRSSFVAAAIVDTSANVPVMALRAD